MAKFFTSDWHIGEKAAPNTHSFLRPYPTEVMAEQWLKQCHEILKPDDTLFMLGDMIINLEDLEFYKRLPECDIVYIVGDKEEKLDFINYINKNNLPFSRIARSLSEEIGGEGQSWRMAHIPTDLFDYALDMPSLCGHVHGIWRTQLAPNGQPIVNVSIDAWGGLVSEEFIMHQYDAIMKNYYDRNARVDLWR